MSRKLGLALLAATVLAIVPAAASAQTLPNLTAVGSTDMQVAVTFAAYSTPQHRADAGAFASNMIDQQGMVGIPNYDPTSEPSSRLVCHTNLQAGELIAVYGIQGQGVYEAANLCQVLQNGGMYVVWGR